MLVASILLLTNIALLIFFLVIKEPGKKGPHGGRGGMMTEFLQKDIGFNAAQMQQYDTLSKQYHEKIRVMFDEAGKNKENQLKQLATEGFSDSAMNSIADQSAANQKKLEIQMFRHLKDIRQICTATQQPKYDSLVYKVLARRNEGRKKQGDNK